jgi:hypothetical protein
LSRTSKDISIPATNASCARQPRCAYHQSLPHPPCYSTKRMWIPCSCHMLMASDTLSKLTVPSLPGRSGTLYETKMGTPSAPSCSKKSSAGGAPSRKSSQTMAPHMSPHWSGSLRGTVSVTYTFRLTTHGQMASSSDSTTPFASPLSRPAMATPPTGPPSCHSCSGLTV